MSSEGGLMGSFSVKAVDERTHIVLSPRGELDLATEGALLHAVAALPDDRRPVVLELAGLTFMDASGLRAVLTARSRLGDRLIVRSGSPQVERLLRLTGVDAQLREESPALEADLERRAANVKLLRRLWRAYCAGGAAELAHWFPGPPRSTGPEREWEWGAADLGRFWASRAPGASAAATAARLDTAGDSVLVACPRKIDGENVAADLIWTVYVFRGRTFIRAVACRSEAEARSCAAAASEPEQPTAP